MTMQIKSFLDPDTETFSHILTDEGSKLCAVIDPVLDFDPKAGRVSYDNADKLIDFVRQNQLQLEYIIETHAHADHLSAAPYLKRELGGRLVIGKHIEKVQKVFKPLFNLGDDFKTDARQFDILTEEGSELCLGSLRIKAIHVPGHTPADMAYLVSDGLKTAVFVGDTLFAPDVGTARCDFPKGSSSDLYGSIQRLLALPDETELYLCHDYPPEERTTHIAKTTVGEQKRSNIHVKQGTDKAAFVKMRDERNATLAMPRLILPSVQTNINAGQLPQPEDNGVRYLKIPLNQL